MTAIIYSKVERLSYLRIHAIPAKPLRDVSLARAPNSDVVVAVDAKGKLYSTQSRAGTTTAITHLDHGRIRSTIEGLMRLGVLSAKAVAEHKAIVAKEDAVSRRKTDAKCLLMEAKDFGIKLTKAQLRVVEKALGGGAPAAAIIKAAGQVPP